ncbi:MAG: hypothetical protein IIV20_05720, partial [Bacteroidaceae bacterium]|nr:hypothetical protein [Bacteroidaceae bacterium]
LVFFSHEFLFLNNHLIQEYKGTCFFSILEEDAGFSCCGRCFCALHFITKNAESLTFCYFVFGHKTGQNR